jgi:hypothetical protein
MSGIRRPFMSGTFLLLALLAAGEIPAWTSPNLPPAPPVAREGEAPETVEEPRTEKTPRDSGAARSLAQALDQEIARVRSHASELDTIGAELERAGRRDRELRTASETHVAELAGQLRVRPVGSPEINELYAEIVGELQQARRSLAEAMDRSRSTTAVPSFEPRFDPAELDVPTLGDHVRQLVELRREVDRRQAGLVEGERMQRRESVDGWGTLTERLNDLRISAIQSLPKERRRQLLGLGREGIAQLLGEIEQFGLFARLYRARRLAQVDEVPGRLRDIFAVGSATVILVKILLALALFFFLRRRGPRIRKASYRATRQAFSTPAGQRRGELLVRVVEVLAPWGLFLALIAAIRWSLGSLATVPELDLPLRIARLYGLYRLSIDVLYAVTLRVVRRYRLPLDERRAEKVMRSVRTMMRVVVGIFVLLILSDRLVGRGYLYFLVVRFAWIFVLGAAALLLARWRLPIADAYLALGAGGRLAGVVDRSRSRWYGVFVSAAAFVLLAGRALLRMGRDFAMGFDQTRRALAFMFRRRVEKHAEQLGYAEGNPDELPPGLVEHFAETPVTDGIPAIAHYPGLDRLQAMIEPWLQKDLGASFLLTGEKGLGKTSWLRQIDAGEVPIDHISLDHRVLSESHLVGTLAKELRLGLEPDAGAAPLRKALSTGPKRVVTIDLGQNLFLGKVGGYDTFESFVSLVEATCDRVFWVCAISAFAWDHLAAVRPDLIVFRDQEALAPWSEEQLGKMLRARTAAAGVEVVYDDLILDSRGARDSTRRVETAEQYNRLLWDYSDGNPRVALHYWLRSLVPESERRLRIRLFRAPASSDLDGIGERSRFLLAAIVVHENLSLQEAVDVTRYPKAVCRLQLERLHDDEILRRIHGRYRLTTHWHRAVVRFLKRGNLLSD